MDFGLLFLSLSLWLLAAAGPHHAFGSTDSCPERLLGEERSRTCPRPCKIDKDCGNKRQCLCDGQCGLSCVAPGRTCPWPLAPGGHSASRLLSPTHSFSALLEVRCNPGFTLPSGLDATIRRCQGDRQWSGDEPICTEAPLPSTLPPILQAPNTGPLTMQPPASPTPICALPDEVLSKLSVQGTAAVGTSILYSCLSGASIVGSSENFCQGNQTWQFPHPICQMVFCVPPPPVEQGYVVAVLKTEYEVGYDIHYLCKKHFLLDGPQKVTCLSNGKWSAPPPHCRARCLLPAQRSRVLIGGEKRWPFDLTDGMVPHGENVTFFCKHPRKQCSLTVGQGCFDGKLEPPECYLEPTWLQYKLFPHRLVSEIDACLPGDQEG
ncbi:beta-2-glycoprotein 1-like [Gadus chalcogrammus]|uniref:beta-2-glycoprotein 1-like n=1 Tax=Gadus chalcogrammus TaxID=1042646 RepID=UPI0024C48539|nr:beta-2-glycoprotein 1-like [Gadus chalcogrammus]